MSPFLWAANARFAFGAEGAFGLFAAFRGLWGFASTLHGWRGIVSRSLFRIHRFRLVRTVKFQILPAAALELDHDFISDRGHNT